MELFEWLNVGTILYSTICSWNGIEITRNPLWICFAAALGVYLVCLILGGIAMNKMAKREGVTGRWMAFVPFLNTYFAGKLAGDLYFFGKKFNGGKIVTAVLEFFYIASVFFNFLMIVILIPYREIVMQNGVESVRYNPPADLNWTVAAANASSIITNVFYFLMLFMFAVVYSALLRKYAPRSYIWLMLLSVLLPFRGVVLFALRNKEGMDYGEYIRRMTGNYGAPQTQTPRPADPFEEFGGGSSGDPFGEFGSAPNKPQEPDDPFSDMTSGDPPKEE